MFPEDAETLIPLSAGDAFHLCSAVALLADEKARGLAARLDGAAAILILPDPED